MGRKPSSARIQKALDYIFSLDMDTRLNAPETTDGEEAKLHPRNRQPVVARILAEEQGSKQQQNNGPSDRDGNPP